MPRNLDIIVCIKPVPDPKKWNRLKLDPDTMLLCRADIPAVLNPLDRNALEQAILLREQVGGRVHAITMAPPEADDQLLEALAMGCDEAVLLTDRAFAGADTLATARTLAAAIRKIGKYDLIFFGGYSLDGSTAQVGPQVAELLALPDLVLATRLEVGDTVRAWCRIDDGEAICECDLPAVVTFSQEANRPRLASMVELRRAATAGIPRWSAADLGLHPDSVGLRGSPTQMLNVFTAPSGRKGEILEGTPDELAANLIERLSKEHILNPVEVRS
jgi:electron transfer flavoprotein alpha/beta subunit